MTKQPVMEATLHLLEGCQRHGHQAEAIHMRRATITRLFHEMDPASPFDPDAAFTTDAVKEAGERLRVLLTEGGAMFGVKLVPEPDVDEMWVHGDGISGA